MTKAERTRERLPRRLEELREAVGLSMDALWQECDVSRDDISRIEGGNRFHRRERTWAGLQR